MNSFHAETDAVASLQRAQHSDREFELLIAAARTVPDVSRINAMVESGVDWFTLLELAQNHSVRPLVYKSLRTTCWPLIPGDVQTAWEEAYRLFTGRNLFLTGELLRITAEFERAGIPVAAMKGAVIAQMAYGDFTLREFNDLDLLVKGADFSRAVALISGIGYQPSWRLDSRKVFHFLRSLGEYKLSSDTFGIDIDLHWRLAHTTVALSPTIRDFPTGFQPLALAGSSVPTFAPQDLPLYLAAQGGADQWSDLRRICDLAEFLRRYPETDWEPHFQVAHRLGGLRSMLAGLVLARDLLGTPLPGSAGGLANSDPVVAQLAATAERNLRLGKDPGEPVSRYRFQLHAKKGGCKKMILACGILSDRTSEDGDWLMLPRPLWWLYAILRPLRMSRKLLRRP